MIFGGVDGLYLWMPTSSRRGRARRELGASEGRKMSSLNGSRARAVADLTAREILAGVEIASTPERVFQALASQEITKWWVRQGVFDTREWTGDLRVGGRWRACGMTRGQPYVQEGEFLEIQAPRRLVHTWDDAGTTTAPSTVTYELERTDGGTRVTLRHAGFASRDVCNAFAVGWETSFDRLAEVLVEEQLAAVRGQD
jgi:uncharacterized protein YndB with AHSA1/START domain